jgi:hypothetical protein
MANKIKLNLGCGENRIEGYVNVDKFGHPDVKRDLEHFPWPWQDNTVQEVRLCHVLEHLGQKSETFLAIMKELYRVCAPNAKINIAVPHPRHDFFLGDPTHVRPIIPETLSLFSKRLNREWAAAGDSNSQLGLYLDVDFELVSAQFVPDPAWEHELKHGLGPDSPIFVAMKRHNNVIKEIKIQLRVIKPAQDNNTRVD